MKKDKKELHKRVRFQGEEYWLHESDWSEGLLSPIEHYDEVGNFTANPFVDVSYAIIECGNIMRFGEKIGEVSELEDVEETND